MSIDAGIAIEFDLGGKLDSMHQDMKAGMRKPPRPNRKTIGIAGNSGPGATSPLLLQLPQYPSVDYTWEIIQAGIFGPDAHTDLVTVVGNPIALAASTVPAYNNNPQGINVSVQGGTVTVIAVNGTATGLTSGTVYVPAGGTLTITYTVAPSLTSSNVVGPTGFVAASPLVNVIADVFCGMSVDPNLVDFSAARISSMFAGSIYNIGHKKIWVQPGEQVYALVYGLQASVPVEFVITVDEWRARDQLAYSI
jgi:hypothetical protein